MPLSKAEFEREIVRLAKEFFSGIVIEADVTKKVYTERKKHAWLAKPLDQALKEDTENQCKT
jgi:hypothetical protein